MHARVARGTLWGIVSIKTVGWFHFICINPLSVQCLCVAPTNVNSPHPHADH